LLEGISKTQPAPVLPLLTDLERHQILVEWNNTTVSSYPQNQCVHQLIEAQAKQTPAIALIFEDQQLTYRELNTSQPGSTLSQKVQLAQCVRGDFHASLEIVGIGILSGSAYVPLAPEYPKERLTFMLEDTQVPVLLTQQRLIEGFPLTPV